MADDLERPHLGNSARHLRRERALGRATRPLSTTDRVAGWPSTYSRTVGPAAIDSFKRDYPSCTNRDRRPASSFGNSGKVAPTGTCTGERQTVIRYAAQLRPTMAGSGLDDIWLRLEDDDSGW
jgi:hypothetical protein